MLERPGLYLEPWRAEAPGGPARRIIRDQATGELLGFAAWRPEFSWAWLNRWLPGRLAEKCSAQCRRRKDFAIRPAKPDGLGNPSYGKAALFIGSRAGALPRARAASA